MAAPRLGRAQMEPALGPPDKDAHSMPIAVLVEEHRNHSGPRGLRESKAAAAGDFRLDLLDRGRPIEPLERAHDVLEPSVVRDRIHRHGPKDRRNIYLVVPDARGKSGLEPAALVLPSRIYGFDSEDPEP